MIDMTRRINAELFGDEAVPPSVGPAKASLDGLERVLRFSLQPADSRADEPVLQRGSAAISARDISQALELVHEAAQNIRAAEERARDGEGRTQALLQRATEELRKAEARIDAAEARVRGAEARATDAEDRLAEAEGRAREAEDWLRQIFSTINQELPPRR